MRERGFTLVEILVALVILSVGLIGLMGAASVAVRAVSDGTLRTRGVALASGRREMLVSSGCAGAAVGSRERTPFAVRWSGGGDVSVVTVTRPSARGPLADSVVGLCGR